MFNKNIAAFGFTVLLAIGSLVQLRGQPTDSLLYILNNNLVKSDTDKYNLLCRIISRSVDPENNLKYFKQAVKIAGELHINPATSYFNIGYCYLDSANLVSALGYFIKAANFNIEYGDEKRLAVTYLAIAETYNKQNNHNNEKYYLNNAIDFFKKTKDTLNLAYALHNLGYAEYCIGVYDTALILYSETKDLFQKIHDSIYYEYCIGNIGLVYSKLAEYDKAEDNLLQAIEFLTRQGDERPVIEFTIEYAWVLFQKGEIKKSFRLAKEYFDKAKKHGNIEYERDAAQLLAKMYRGTGRYDSAFHYQSVYISTNDSIQSDRNIREMADLRTAYEVEQRQAKVEILEKSNFLTRIIILGLIIILALAIGLILVYYNSLKRSKKLTAELDERRALLEKQGTELREKNDSIIIANKELKQLYEISNSQKEEIISSINYAQRIQQAILPPETYITELINENFVFFKPKEIVSGDFYWIKQINHNIVLVSADCTGHGVPGAFMSMLGIGYLNEIVQNKKEIHANQILNELRKEIKHSLRQTGKTEESREGIEMALCVIDTSTGVMQYSGAFSPLYIISNTNGKPQLKEIKADSMPVGVHFLIDKSFTNHEIKLEIGDTFYMFTDGFIDQVGGSKDNRFGSKNFQKLLLKICELPMFEQKNILEKTFNEWKGDQSQRDDILVIGARV